MIVRALRLTGVVDDARLLAAVREATTSLELLTAPSIGADTAADDTHCLKMLAAQRERCLVQLYRLPNSDTEDHVVLAVAADPMVLDLRSAYLLLGAVMQAYFGRFRAIEYPSYTEAVGGIDNRVAPSRAALWARRVGAWPRRWPTADVDNDLHVPFPTWAKLCGIGDYMGNHSSITVIALLAWWLRFQAGRVEPATFLAELDLREYHGLGSVIGPLTDRIAFQVDVTPEMSFRELVRRCHAGVLDAVVHYVPFQVVRELPCWPGCDVAVHYCRTPPLSSATRGEETLERLGLSIELFHEGALARLTGHTPDAALSVDVAESGDGVELIGIPLEISVIDKVIADPDIPLARL
ncbi:hypothetical protein Rhe02_15150 [Rhizocola hellebori]|uniref:Condensation domain-containing protein n=1 Tax=Rhizocola hellebori TaxID=1392758 RepID=A0A8J3VEZ6_9ACTN|nr:hypothetical protein [Rhizocola hellebori]GIH03448.1 hypothetical protein Rhe02_15150 [Rhizocola hellebori]